MKVYIVILFFVLFSLPKISNAQLSNSDSIFLNSVFTESPYQDTFMVPGYWYVNSYFNSIPSFYNLLNDNFKFHKSDFFDAYKKIQINDFKYDTLLNFTMNYYFNNFGNAYKQLNPCVIQNFTLNGVNANAYATYSPGMFDSSCSIGYLVIPGSLNNQTTELIQGIGYHNVNCYLKNKLTQSGDVYLYCKPLEDYRAILWNSKKLNSSDYKTPGPPSFVYSYLRNNDKPYGVNYLIECMALVKMMKQKYQKVVVVGCSLGGYSALLTSLNTPVDDVIIASGYSILFDVDPEIVQELHSVFDSIPALYPAQVIKQKIEQSNQRYYFSWAEQDNYHFQLEHDSLYTFNFFNGVSNNSYYTNFTSHSFPTCSILDSVVDGIKQHHTARFQLTSHNGTNGLARLSICPDGTYSGNIIKNGLVFDTFSNVTNELQYFIQDAGTFKISNLRDGQFKLIPCEDSVIFQKSPLSITAIQDTKLIYNIENPFRNTIKIDSHFKLSNKLIVEIKNLNGCTMFFNDKFSLDDEIDASTWTSGIYIVQIRHHNHLSHFKLVKI